MSMVESSSSSSSEIEIVASESLRNKNTGNTFVDNSDPNDTTDYSVCSVCMDGTTPHDRNLIFCEGCNVAVHRFVTGT
eukprot:UN00836